MNPPKAATACPRERRLSGEGAWGQRTFEGGGGDALWSTAANGSPDAVFTPGADVPDPFLRFNSAPGSQNVVDGAYTGIQSLVLDVSAAVGVGGCAVGSTAGSRLGFGSGPAQVTGQRWTPGPSWKSKWRWW